MEEKKGLLTELEKLLDRIEKIENRLDKLEEKEENEEEERAEIEAEVESEPNEESCSKPKQDWYDWEIDYPAEYVENLIESMGINDKMQFINELFEGSEIAFENDMHAIDGMENFKQIEKHFREEHPEWDETSETVYKFYMHIRRKFRT